MVASPSHPALSQDLGKESTWLHLWPQGDAAPWSGGTCLALAMQCHIPWERFTFTSVGKQQDVQGLPVFGGKGGVGCPETEQ